MGQLLFPPVAAFTLGMGLPQSADRAAIQPLPVKDSKMISVLIIASLLICLAFSLWLNFRLSYLVIFYAYVPIRPAPPPCHKGLEYTITQFPIVPIVLKLMIRHHKGDPKLPNISWTAVEQAKNG
jgi:hypothetical protein